MTILEQIAELGSYDVGAAVAGVFVAGVLPLRLLAWGVDKMMEAFR